MGHPHLSLVCLQVVPGLKITGQAVGLIAWCFAFTLDVGNRGTVRENERTQWKSSVIDEEAKRLGVKSKRICMIQQ